MRDLVKLVGLDLAVFHTNSRRFFVWYFDQYRFVASPFLER